MADPVKNPAVAPAGEPVEGDNLTQEQASLILAVFKADPDAVVNAAEELELSDDDVDDLLTVLADMAGEPDEESETDAEDGEADPEEEEAA